MSNTFYSQFNQDEIINIILQNKKNGVFLDIGAYDGITFSNSYFFEKSNNWTGICFEPNPITFKKLSEIRNATLINGGVSSKDGILTFKRFEGNQELEMLSGFSDFFTEEQLRRIENELKQEPQSLTETIQVQTLNINNLLIETKINKVDYCSIDTEGGEFEILKTINFKKTYFATLSVEDNGNSQDVVQYMNSQGFLFLFIWKCDLFFVNKKEKFGVSLKLKLLKYYTVYYLKKTGFVYRALNGFYKVFKN